VEPKALNKVFGAAIAALGPEGVLRVLPLVPHRDSAEDIVTRSRWWLLPIIKSDATKVPHSIETRSTRHT
jgi:hypothetical protein